MAGLERKVAGSNPACDLATGDLLIQRMIHLYSGMCPLVPKKHASEQLPDP